MAYKKRITIRVSEKQAEHLGRIKNISKYFRKLIDSDMYFQSLSDQREDTYDDLVEELDEDRLK